MHLIALTQNIVNIQSELNLIGANARSLRGPGRDLLPLKADMLGAFTPAEQNAILEAVELLFAAVLQFVDAQLKEQHATDTIGIVAARIDKGQADGTVTALIHGSTRYLLLAACEHAPIAMHSIMQAAPELSIQKRLENALSRDRVIKSVR